MNHPKKQRSRLPISLALRGLLFMTAYYFATLLGYALIFPSSYISILWPPNTILVVALLLTHRKQWPFVLMIVFPVHLLAQAQFGVTPFFASLYYTYDCVLVILTAAALQRFGLGDVDLADIRNTLRFIGIVTLSDAIGTLFWSHLIIKIWPVADPGKNPWTAWNLAFLSNLLPFLIALPGLMAVFSHGMDMLKKGLLQRSVEFVLLNLALFGCALGVFGLAPKAVSNLPALFYTPLPFLLWAAVRFGPGGLSFSFLIFALMAMFNAIEGYGPFVTPSAGESVLRLQIFLLAIYVPLLVLASVVRERQDKEDALKRSEAEYRAVVEDQTELIGRFLPDGTFTFVNDAFCRYVNRSRKELIGSGLWDLLPAEGQKTIREVLASITPEHPLATREHEFIASIKEPHWYHWRDRGFFDAQGRIIEYQVVGHDITERKRLEEMTERLAHAGRLAALGELTASIAHEINQPLGAILSNASTAAMLLESESPSLDEMRAIVSDIHADNIRASEVISRIGVLVRKQEALFLPLDLNEVIREVIRFISPDARVRKVKMEAELASEIIKIRGDRVHLQQVLVNLVRNAMDAMIDTPQEKRRILVRTDRNKDHSVLVSISDTGHGIPSDKLSTVFESFFSTKEHGMGLGLAIARSFIEIHEGRIWASNNSDGGATFYFTLNSASPED